MCTVDVQLLSLRLLSHTHTALALWLVGSSVSFMALGLQRFTDLKAPRESCVCIAVCTVQCMCLLLKLMDVPALYFVLICLTVKEH